MLFWSPGQPYPQHGCSNFLPRYIEAPTRPPVPPGTLREPKYAQPRPAAGAPRARDRRRSPPLPLRSFPGIPAPPHELSGKLARCAAVSTSNDYPRDHEATCIGNRPRHPAARCSYLLFWLRSTAPSQIVPGLPSPRVLVMNGDQSTDHAEARGVERRATCRHGGGALKTRVTY